MSIYVIDDHPLMREAVAMLVRRIRPGAQVLELSKLSELPRAMVGQDEAELVCLDLKLPDASEVEGVKLIRRYFPQTPLAVISATPAAQAEECCREAGADVYLEKSAGAGEIGAALRAMLVSDSQFLDDEGEAQPGGPIKLTKRQRQLLLMLDEGLSNRDIGERLNISEHTVKVHFWRLFRRLGVKSRTQALHVARLNGLLSPA